MDVGFLTSIFRKDRNLEQVVEWSAENGFSMIEVLASPGSPHIDPSRDQGRVSEIRDLLSKHGVSITSLAFHPNNLDTDLEARRKNHEHLKRCIEMANRLEVDVVGTFVGSPGNFLSQRIEIILPRFQEAFTPLVEHAEDHDVKLAIENCPLGGWNIAYSPSIWSSMFQLVPSKNLGLNLDPSHLYWLFVDYKQAVYDFQDRIFHTHAKDTEILYNRLNDVGILSRGWWRYRIPGWGEISWEDFITALRETGYDFVLSIEHEDPVFKGEEGLLLGKKYLNTLLP